MNQELSKEKVSYKMSEVFFRGIGFFFFIVGAHLEPLDKSRKWGYPTEELDDR